jgi:beta-galactosidase
VKAEVRVDGADYLVTVVKDLLKGDAQSIISYYIHPDGSMDVKNNFKAIRGSHKLLMRAGNNLELNKSLQQITFYGRGPGENYWDRKSASLVGLFKQTLDEQYFPYARPQESGNKSDIRWVSLTDKNGKGIKFAFVDSLLNFSALPYSLDDLDPEVEKKQYHSGELEPRDKIYMHLDLNQIGLQGIDSWGSQPLEQYRIPFDDFFYSYRIIPLK